MRVKKGQDFDLEKYRKKEIHEISHFTALFGYKIMFIQLQKMRR